LVLGKSTPAILAIVSFFYYWLTLTLLELGVLLVNNI